MDRDRFKNKKSDVPVKRSINSEENPKNRAVTNLPQQVPPAKKQPSNIPTTFKAKANTLKPTEPVPMLFDGEDDDDLFGVWVTQKKLKKARQAQENKEKAAKMAAKMLKKEQKKVAKKTAKPHEFALSVSVPRVSKYKKKHPKIFYAISFTIVAIIIGVGFGIYSNMHTNKKGIAEVLGVASAKPDFATVYPSGTSATTLKYDTEKKVASYSDVVAGVPITISQQPLPSSFKEDPMAEVTKLATQINANEKISAADIIAYAGVSIKGPQTVVFTKNDLLIFIIAEKKIQALDWIAYLESIR